jgi:hypothetical protein
MRSLRLLLPTSLLLAATAALALPPGTASGTLTVNGKVSKLQYAYATPNAKEKTVMVLLADAPVPQESLTGNFGRAELAGSGKLNGIEVEIDADRNIVSGMIYSSELKKYGGSFSASGMHELHATVFGAKDVEGSLRTAKEEEFFGTKWQYDATFHAAAAPPPAAKNGQPLPAGGGAPGAAYAAYLEALKSGDIAALRKAVSADRAKSMDSPEFPKTLKMVQVMQPENVKVTGGTLDGATAMLDATAKDSTGTITMRLEGGAWKVAFEKWSSR